MKFLLPVFLMILACGGEDPSPGAQVFDAGFDTGFDTSLDSTLGHDGSAELDTSAIRAIIEAALADAPAGIDGVTLIVYDAEDRRVIEETVGDFSPDRRVPIASASKLVSGLVILRLLDANILSMSDTPASVLGWSATSAQDATLDHLGAFVSGMEPEARCLFDPAASLQGCVRTLDTVPVLSSPGTAFRYGSTHLAVMASMAETQTGESWATLFERELKEPLGLTDPGLRYFTLPKERLGENNPLVAGGLQATANEYMQILSALFHRGRVNDMLWISETAIARMGVNAYPDATIDPMLARSNFRYSWSSWINCEGAASPCENITSPGAFGFTPWIDRSAGYYAVLAMESDGLNGTGFGVPLMELVRPEIEALSF